MSKLTREEALTEALETADGVAAIWREQADTYEQRWLQSEENSLEALEQKLQADLHWEVWKLCYIRSRDGVAPFLASPVVVNVLRGYLAGGYGEPDPGCVRVATRALATLPVGV